MSSFEIKQKDILVTNNNRTRARPRASRMAWTAPFPQSRLSASVEFINKASVCKPINLGYSEMFCKILLILGLFLHGYYVQHIPGSIR